jgi:hypothetical protein
MTTDILLLTMTLRRGKPILSPGRAPHNDKTVIAEQHLISGHETQMRLDTKTD